LKVALNTIKPTNPEAMVTLVDLSILLRPFGLLLSQKTFKLFGFPIF